MTDLELETLEQMRELCAEQMERAPTSCEYVDWRNKSWIIDGILDDEKERRELTTVHSEENETENENVTENKTESEDIEMSSTTDKTFFTLSERACKVFKKSFKNLVKYKSPTCNSNHSLKTNGIVVLNNSLIFFATNGVSVYYTNPFKFTTLELISGNWYCKKEGIESAIELIESSSVCPLELSYDRDGTITFKRGGKTVDIETWVCGGTMWTDLYRLKETGTEIESVRLINAFQISDVRKKKGRSSEADMMMITVDDDGSMKLDGEKLITSWTPHWKHSLRYVYDKMVPTVFNGKKTPLDWKVYGQRDYCYYVFTAPDSDEMIINTFVNGDTEKIINEPIEEVKPTAEPEPIKKEETEMTATEIKPAQETGNFTFSVSTSPTDFECIGLDYKPSIDLTKPTDKKTPEPVECKRPDLGEFIQGNKTYELYRNDELKRYRLTFKRHLTKDERDFLWTNKWTWRKEFKCYQWGYTKNGDEAARNAIEYFEKR